jgi:RsiW-degrading membrane proteinase PrsW (M82 family)
MSLINSGGKTVLPAKLFAALAGIIFTFAFLGREHVLRHQNLSTLFVAILSFLVGLVLSTVNVAFAVFQRLGAG